MVLALAPDERSADAARARYRELAGRVAFVGRARRRRTGSTARRSAAARSRPDDPLRGTWTVVVLGPGFDACFVARAEGDGDEWAFAVTVRPRDRGRVRADADGADASRFRRA